MDTFRSFFRLLYILVFSDTIIKKSEFLLNNVWLDNTLMMQNLQIGPFVIIDKGMQQWAKSFRVMNSKEEMRVFELKGDREYYVMYID